MINSWVVALKEFNKNKSIWCIPKKGTKEYNEVRKIMDNMDTKKKVKEKK